MYAGKKIAMTRENFVEFMVNVFESEEKEANDLFGVGSDDKRDAITFGKTFVFFNT